VEAKPFLRGVNANELSLKRRDWERSLARHGFWLALFLSATPVASSNAQEKPIALSCEGTLALWDPSFQEFKQSGVLLTIGREITVQNLPAVSATWPVVGKTDDMIFINSGTDEGGQVAGSINRVTGDFSIFAVNRPVGSPGARAIMQFQGRCAPAHHMF
jgi:hypothetical protein